MLAGARLPAVEVHVQAERGFVRDVLPSRCAVLEVRDQAAANGDLVVQRPVCRLEVREVGVQGLVVLEELAHVLGPGLDVRDQLLALRGELLELRREVVDEPLVGLAVRRLDDDEQRRPAAGASELVLEGLEAGAVSRQKLEEVGA